MLSGPQLRVFLRRGLDPDVRDPVLRVVGLGLGGGERGGEFEIGGN